MGRAGEMLGWLRGLISPGVNPCRHFYAVRGGVATQVPSHGLGGRNGPAGRAGGGSGGAPTPRHPNHGSTPWMAERKQEMGFAHPSALWPQLNLLE